jgi:hypothetical protein
MASAFTWGLAEFAFQSAGEVAPVMTCRGKIIVLVFGESFDAAHVGLFASIAR